MASKADAKVFSHAREYAPLFPDRRDDLAVGLLIGASCSSALQCHTYGGMTPYIHETPLGFSLVGPSNEGSSPCTDRHRTLLTVHDEGEGFVAPHRQPPSIAVACNPLAIHLEEELPGPSQEDCKFMTLMHEQVSVDGEGNIVLPLPFRPEPQPPHNRATVYARASRVLEKLLTRGDRLAACLDTMQK